ncbi:MAG TPA: hypothetical protein VMZ92_07955 [Planctomycetota bacterium]|nr:hypothetical protein [Planctomycetota bacterium]
MILTLTLTDEESRLLTYATKASGASVESIALTLIRSGLDGYKAPMLQAEAEDALALKVKFDAAAPTDTKATIVSRLVKI